MGDTHGGGDEPGEQDDTTVAEQGLVEGAGAASGGGEDDRPDDEKSGRASITVQRGDFEEHNQLRKAADLSWVEYLNAAMTYLTTEPDGPGVSPPDASPGTVERVATQDGGVLVLEGEPGEVTGVLREAAGSDADLPLAVFDASGGTRVEIEHHAPPDTADETANAATHAGGVEDPESGDILRHPSLPVEILVMDVSEPDGHGAKDYNVEVVDGNGGRATKTVSFLRLQGHEEIPASESEFFDQYDVVEASDGFPEHAEGDLLRGPACAPVEVAGWFEGAPAADGVASDRGYVLRRPDGGEYTLGEAGAGGYERISAGDLTDEEAEALGVER